MGGSSLAFRVAVLLGDKLVGNVCSSSTVQSELADNVSRLHLWSCSGLAI